MGATTNATLVCLRRIALRVHALSRPHTHIPNIGCNICAFSMQGEAAEGGGAPAASPPIEWVAFCTHIGLKVGGLITHTQMLQLYDYIHKDARIMACVRETEARLSIKLFRFQLISLYLLGRGHNVILQGPCGGGKSTIYNMLGEHVPTLSVLTQAQKGKIIIIASTKELTRNQVYTRARARVLCSFVLAPPRLSWPALTFQSPQEACTRARYEMLDPVMLDGDSKDADFKAARDPKCRAGMSISGFVVARRLRHCGTADYCSLHQLFVTVFMTPEMAEGPRGSKLLTDLANSGDIALIGVDESHQILDQYDNYSCLSQSLSVGNKFRSHSSH
jgi:hypothetical protein